MNNTSFHINFYRVLLSILFFVGLAAVTPLRAGDGLDSVTPKISDNTHQSQAIFDMAVEIIVEADSEQDYEQAFSLFQRAARQGHSGSTINLARMYELGIGVKKDADMALSLYRTVGDAGFPIGYFYAAQMFATGESFKVDQNKVIENYLMAIKMNHAPSMTNMGVIYATGRGIEKDEKKAFSLFCKAALLGDVYGVQNMGLAFLNGVGTPRDVSLSKKLLNFSRTKKNVYLGSSSKSNSIVTDLSSNTALRESVILFMTGLAQEEGFYATKEICGA